jgi:hypothetical protein
MSSNPESGGPDLLLVFVPALLLLAPVYQGKFFVFFVNFKKILRDFRWSKVCLKMAYSDCFLINFQLGESVLKFIQGCAEHF